MCFRFFLLCCAGLACTSASVPARAGEPGAGGLATVIVGNDHGDIRGDDHRALQMAVDYVANLGGGRVVIAPGRYTMRNALILRDNVTVQGTPGETVLVAAGGRSSLLAVDGDCNERQITLADPQGFRVGDGVSIHDERNGGGFEVTTATLTEQLDDRTFRISSPLYLDYLVSQQATARQAYPIVGGWGVKHCTIAGLVIDGNAEKSQPLNGCRGGGIFLFECENIHIRDCRVHNYPGDGISFQVSQRVHVEDCTVTGNTGLGLHPGSGSQHPVLRENVSRENGGDGLFVCWRVKHGLFENNLIENNGGQGISIGHKDTDNLFRNNRILGNSQAGIFFRNESEAMGAHRNVFEQNIILDNGLSDDGRVVAPSIRLRGHHHDVVFRNNTIGLSTAPDSPAAAVNASPHTEGLDVADNQFKNVNSKVHVRE